MQSQMSREMASVEALKNKQRINHELIKSDWRRRLFFSGQVFGFLVNGSKLTRIFLRTGEH